MGMMHETKYKGETKGSSMLAHDLFDDKELRIWKRNRESDF